MTASPRQGNWELAACPQLLHDGEIRPPHSCHDRASNSDASIQSPARYQLHHRASHKLQFEVHKVHGQDHVWEIARYSKHQVIRDTQGVQTTNESAISLSMSTGSGESKAELTGPELRHL